MMSSLATVVADLPTHEQRLVGESSTSAFDNSSTRIVFGSALVGYKILDAATLKPLVSGFKGRSGNRPQYHPTSELMLTDICCCTPVVANDASFPIELWDATTGDDIGTTGWRLNCGFWYPNGKGFIGYALERIEFWDLDPQQWVDAACRFAGRNLTRDEWDRYGPKDTYRDTCA
jgi:hypothetical protein